MMALLRQHQGCEREGGGEREVTIEGRGGKERMTRRGGAQNDFVFVFE